MFDLSGYSFERPIKVARFLLVCIFLLSFVTAAFALNPDRDIHRLTHRSWGEKEGYPGKGEALAQTTDGFLWLGSDNGLFRFDGVHFERYVPRSGDKLPEGSVRALRALSDGSLGIDYRHENKIYVLRNGNVKCYGTADGVTSNPNTIVQDHEGTIWANSEAGVIRFNGRRWEHIDKDWNFPEDVPNMTSHVLFVDSLGTLWAGVNHTILYLKRGSKRFEPTGACAGWSSSIAEAPDGTMWMSDLSSYVRAISTSVSAKSAATAEREVETPTATPATAFSEDPLMIKITVANNLTFDRNGSLWIATDTSGMFRIPHPELLKERPISKTSDALQTFASTDGLSADACGPILEDREGNIWVATRDGLDQFRDTALVPVIWPKSLIRVAVAPADGGDIWAAGTWHYVARIHGDSGNVSLIPADAFKVYRDPTGVTWIIGNSLGRFEDGGFRTVAQCPDGLAAGPGTWQIAGDRFGTLWAFSNGHGFFSLEHDRWKAWTTPLEVAKQRVANMFSDSSGRIWVSTYEGGVITMDRGSVVDYSVKPDSSLSYVKAFAERAPQEIWAGGAGGLVLIDKGHFRPIKSAALDSLEDVTGIVDAGSEGLWLNASGGVIHISRDEVDRALRDPSYRFQLEQFDSSDGLPGQTEEIYPYPKAVQGTDGRIWFTATRGVAWVDPKYIPKNAVPPPISITSVFADGSEYLQLADLRLPTHTANIQINYSALSLSVPERVHFRYKLDGVDLDWQNVRSRRQAFYTNLPAGTYHFHVIACNDSGVWNETGDHLDFSIAAAWYQTNLFRVSCVVAFALLLWMLYQLRVRSIQLRSKQLALINAKLERQIEDNSALYTDLQLQVDVLQRLPVSAWTLKPDGTPDFVNRVWLEFSGQTVEFVRSHPAAWMTAVHPEDREMAAKIFLEGVHSGQDFAIETRSLRAKDGTYRWHLQQAVVMRDSKGKVLKFVGTTTDIDDQKCTEEAMRRAQTELAHVSRITTLGEMTASIAHEVNQPLGSVVNNANACLSILSSGSPHLDEVRQALEEIIAGADRASAVISRIRSLSKKMPYENALLDLNHVVTEVMSLVKHEAVTRQVDIQINTADDLPTVSGDRVQLQQVLLNLIVNGMEAMATIEPSKRAIVISGQRELQGEEPWCVMSVLDVGIGIRSGDADSLFEAFYKTKPEGMGMGLAISRSIIEAHGGKLWVDVEHGPGAKFLFRLPAEQGAKP